MVTEVVDHAIGRRSRADPVTARSGGPAGNALLTAWIGLTLLVLSVAELLTLFDVRGLIDWHVVIGALLIPPALVKTASTSWRMVRYYLGNEGYRTSGPPPMLLRLLGPLVVASTAALLATGIVADPARRTRQPHPSTHRGGRAHRLGQPAPGVVRRLVRRRRPPRAGPNGAGVATDRQAASPAPQGARLGCTDHGGGADRGRRGPDGDAHRACRRLLAAPNGFLPALTAPTGHGRHSRRGCPSLEPDSWRSPPAEGRVGRPRWRAR